MGLRRARGTRPTIGALGVVALSACSTLPSSGSGVADAGEDGRVASGDAGAGDATTKADAEEPHLGRPSSFEPCVDGCHCSAYEICFRGTVCGGPDGGCTQGDHRCHRMCDRSVDCAPAEECSYEHFTVCGDYSPPGGRGICCAIGQCSGSARE